MIAPPSFVVVRGPLMRALGWLLLVALALLAVPSAFAGDEPQPEPDTIIQTGPPPFTTSTTADLTFTSKNVSEPEFWCALDNEMYAPCNDGTWHRANLAPGQHVFWVYVHDRRTQRTDESPANWEWVVEAPTPLDAGSPGGDGGVPGGDAGSPDDDGGSSGSDAGTGANDGGTPESDAGTGGNDGGSSGSDAGTGGNDGGSSGTDAGTGGNDGGSSGTDAGAGDNDGGTSEPDGGPGDNDGGTAEDDAGPGDTDGGSPGNEDGGTPGEDDGGTSGGEDSGTSGEDGGTSPGEDAGTGDSQDAGRPGPVPPGDERPPNALDYLGGGMGCTGAPAPGALAGLMLLVFALHRRRRR
ncbi:MYXO-CTERM sorting domain-containing protein [Pyxidicoccus trucidator]|uniref:MYXO-CTERM sorting domain-containing protein n=1 Tax=Pyxidicoccus trucidator TaxID=2709662 RepID=UPI0013DBBE40|nr:MYXO-CTERM sorting domain-containing protein [Pyxidicoccus trucidator]